MRRSIVCLVTAMSLGALVFTGCGGLGSQNAVDADNWTIIDK